MARALTVLALTLVMVANPTPSPAAEQGVLFLNPPITSPTDERKPKKPVKTSAGTSRNSILIAAQGGGRGKQDQSQVMTNHDSRVFETAPACGLGGQAICTSGSACPDGEELLAVYEIVRGTRHFAGTFCPQEVSAPPQQITNLMVLRALRRVTLPKPALSIQPPGGKTLVNFETIFSTDAQPFMRTVRLLGHRVQLDITPTSYVWSYGDGTTETTAEPGIAWEQGRPMSDYLTHMYEDANITMQPQVSVTYGARFRVDGGPWRDVSGTVTSDGPPVDLRVIEAETRLLS